LQEILDVSIIAAKYYYVSFKTTEYKFHRGHMKIQMSLHLEVLKNQQKVVKMTFKVHNKIIACKVNNKLNKTMFQLKKKINKVRHKNNL